MTKIEIVGYYNRIAFEGGDFPEDGNGQAHTRAAALAWDDAATSYIHDAGYGGGSEIRHGNDSCLHGPFLSGTVDDESGDDGQPVDLTAEELAAATTAWKAADAAGWAAVAAYCERANSEFAAPTE